MLSGKVRSISEGKRTKVEWTVLTDDEIPNRNPWKFYMKVGWGQVLLWGRSIWPNWVGGGVGRWWEMGLQICDLQRGWYKISKLYMSYWISWLWILCIPHFKEAIIVTNNATNLLQQPTSIMVGKQDPTSVLHCKQDPPVWIPCIVCSSSWVSPVSCWYLPWFNFIFFLAPLMSTHTLKTDIWRNKLFKSIIQCMITMC